jgi:DNA-directed RNA polymerase subunit RPC12/RpoP
LLHFSVDYDQPGTIIACAQCGHASGESRIGYRCLDCGQKGDAERLEMLDVSSYALTATARATVFDASWRPESQHLLSASERALLRVESFLEAPHEANEKRAVVAVRAMRNGHAVSPGDLAGNLLLAGRIMGERFPQCETVGGAWNEILVLVQSTHLAKFEQELARAADDCKRLLASSVKIEIDILGPR